ncbi:MAG: hypothetical protein AAGI23_11475 [Bacteroidota bacterium]
MKKIIFSFCCCCLLLLTTQAQAQREDRSSRGLNDRIWIGSTFILPNFFNFGGQSNFFLGLTPQVGIRIFDDMPGFSVGPRAGITYSNRRLVNPRTGQVESLQPISYSVGAFARQKVLRQFFAQAEIELESAAFADPNAFEVVREQRQNYYLGAGYNSGGRIGYEMMILYNFNHPTNSLNTPFDLRVGFTYQF